MLLKTVSAIMIEMVIGKLKIVRLHVTKGYVLVGYLHDRILRAKKKHGWGRAICMNHSNINAFDVSDDDYNHVHIYHI